MTFLPREGRRGSSRRRGTGTFISLVLLAAWAGRAEASEGAPPGQPAEPQLPAAAPSSQPPSPPAPVATDPEEPAWRPQRPSPAFPAAPRYNYRLRESPPPRIRNPLWGLMFELGIGGGGDDLVKVSLSDGSDETLSAGDGVSIAVGLMVTPLWLGDSLGVGVTGTAGYKAWSVGGSNGSIGLSRFPLTLGVHLLPRLSPLWLLLVRGGIDKETSVSISGSGVAAGTGVDLSADLGGFVEAGFYKIMDTPEQRGAWSLTFRYTKLTYSANGASADASSFMIFSALYFNP